MMIEAANAWPIHDLSRPQPPVVSSLEIKRVAAAATAPREATVLFDGRNLAAWEHLNGSAPKWRIVGDAMDIRPKSGNLRTKETFGSGHWHLEWRAPRPRPGEGQEGSNSGVFLMGLYEVQILDSFENPTYADGVAGAVYGQYPPSANPCRPPGEWNFYDLTFVAPRFDADGTVREPARITLIFNGVKVQDAVALTGPTAHKKRPPYAPHADRLPLVLQDHKNPLQFRNIWFVPLP